MKFLSCALTLCLILIAVSSRSEIPFGDAIGTYSSTKDDLKEISPFWGMVALHGRIIENLRFFGLYKTPLPLSPEQKTQEVGLDSIVTLIKELFPSPDGVQLVANTRTKDPVGDLSRNLSSIGDIIKVLIFEKDDETKKIAIGNIIDNNAKVSKRKLGEDDKNFSNLLVDAFNEQRTFANNNEPQQQRYPNNIIPIALLAYFAKVADFRDDFRKIAFFFDDKFDAKKTYGNEDYYRDREKYRKDMKSLLASSSPEDIEKAFLLAIGDEKIENPFSRPIFYRGDVCIVIKGKPGESFPDCGETSLRNILMLLLEKDKAVSQDTLFEIGKKLKSNVDLAKTPFNQIVEYFKEFPSLNEASSLYAHKKWASVVSNLNQTLEEAAPQKIQYGRGKGTYEIKADFSNIGIKGIINMLNVIAKIFPDEKLNMKWPTKADSVSFDEAPGFKMAAQKLDRLFELLSSKARKITWENAKTEDRTIDTHFVSIIISINGSAAYRWEFIKGHFQIFPIATAKNDWRLKLGYGEVGDKPFVNEWIASLYFRWPRIDDQINKSYGANIKPWFFPWMLWFGSHADLRDINNAINAIAFILYQKHTYSQLQQFMPLLERLIYKSIPLNDEHSLSLISLAVGSISTDQGLKTDIDEIMQRFPEIEFNTKPITNLTANQISKRLVTSRFFLPLIIFSKSEQFDELDLSRNETLTDNVLRNLSTVKKLNLSENSLISNIGLVNLQNLTDLNLRNNQKITGNSFANLDNLTGLNLVGNSTIKSDDVASVEKLTNLDLAYNITITDAALANLKQLTNLNLSGNNEITGASLANLKNITHLDLSWNITIKDADVANLEKLTNLNLTGNKEINGDVLTNLEKLTNLNLTINLTINDASLANLKNLTSLDLSYNQNITDNGLANLKNLTSLNLTGNSTINNAGLANLKNLTDLNLSGNQTISNAGLANLENLVNLNLTHNFQITDGGLANLKKLTNLTLTNKSNISSEFLLSHPWIYITRIE